MAAFSKGHICLELEVNWALNNLRCFLMHCSTLDYVTSIAALPHASWMLVCCLSQRCLSTTARCSPDVCLLHCRRAPRSILPLRSHCSTPDLLTCTRKFKRDGPNIKPPSGFSGSSAKRNGVGLCRDAPGPVAMAMAGLYLVQLFHCARLCFSN